MTNPSPGMKSALRITLALVVLAALVYFAGAIVYTRVPDSRKMASELMLAAAPLREQIADIAQRQGSLEGVGAKIPPPAPMTTKYGTASVSVSSTGGISIRSQKPDLTLELVPRLEGGAVNWHCSGAPAVDMPLACRKTP
jgi:hypothetical protein